MMVTYYVHIPNSEAPTAEVEASTTKHARTAYLDYLSRNGIIAWQQRQATRKLVKISRMQPGEIQTQVKLEYGVSEPPVREVEAPLPQEGVPQGYEDDEVDMQSRQILQPRTPSQVETVTYRPGLEASSGRRMSQWRGFKPSPGLGTTSPNLMPIGDSKIAQLSRKSKGM